MKIGMMNDPAKDILGEIRFAGKNGFDFIDLTIEPPEAQVEDFKIEEILLLFKKYNLDIVGHTNYYLMYASPIKRLKDASIEEIKEHLEIFQRLGVGKVNIHPHWFQPISEKEDIVESNIKSLRELVDFAKKIGIKIMLENTPHGFLNKPESLETIFEQVDGLCFHLDVGHAQVAGEGENLTERFLSLFGERLAHVHFSDNKGKDDDHLPIGAGIIDWEDIVRQLKSLGYEGTITLEVFVKDRDYLLLSKEKIRKLWSSVSSRQRI